jgi:hypothetical protein
MKRMAIALLVLAGITAATSAMAVDLRASKGALPQQQQHLNRPARFSVTAVQFCDDGSPMSAYYQNTDDRIGNVFDFGSGAVLSAVGFAHYGFGFAGPYNYDLELWDPTSCTFIASVNNQVASDAASSVPFDVLNVCGSNLFVAGNVGVMIDPNSCLSPTDCYPDILFDDQIGVPCPYIIADASTAPACLDYSPVSGPFIVEVETDNCPTPAAKHSWGSVKTLYR